MSKRAIRQAVILAGGKGTRLGAITRSVPKPMLPIAGGRPFLDYLLEMIERHGYQDILLLGGYLGEVLEAAYGGRRIGDATIRVLREQVPLGTAGALTVARETLDPYFLMMNGDAFFDINLRALEQASHKSGAMATLALRSVPDAARYGRVIEEQGNVVAFLEKDLNRLGPGVINGGVYVLKREILDLVHDLPCSLEHDVSASCGFPWPPRRGRLDRPCRRDRRSDRRFHAGEHALSRLSRGGGGGPRLGKARKSRKATGRHGMSKKAIRQAVILAGGKGTRLGAITRSVPKPMLPIAGGRPFLDYLHRDDRTPWLPGHPPARGLSRRGS